MGDDSTATGQGAPAPAPSALAALDRAWDTARSAAAGELGTLRIGYSLSAGAETAPALVDRLIRGNSGLEVGAVPMATPEISPAVTDGRIDAGITRGEQPGRGVRRFLLRRARVGVQPAQHHPLAERPEVRGRRRGRVCAAASGPCGQPRDPRSAVRTVPGHPATPPVPHARSLFRHLSA
ncbi:LysR substrate-binding domain-containing protein [Streptomyces nondiastaticus]|uniref:LysR substrate-binding domain-containing protein n=1 Tax=Streptomyces nondiastaticus TaxID=3154512 RepID=A0ABW6UAK3_9ACTN